MAKRKEQNYINLEALFLKSKGEGLELYYDVDNYPCLSIKVTGKNKEAIKSIKKNIGMFFDPDVQYLEQYNKMYYLNTDGIKDRVDKYFGGENDLRDLVTSQIGKRFFILNDTTANYVGLWDKSFINLSPVMTNILPEKIDNLPIVEKGRGNILVGGLGLGMILIPLMKNPDVKSIDVIEISEEIIKLTTANIEFNEKVNIIHSDISQFDPNGKKYDVIWLDTVDDSLCSDKEFEQRSEDGQFLRDDVLSKRFENWLAEGGESIFYDPAWSYRENLEQETAGMNGYLFKDVEKSEDSHTITAIDGTTGNDIIITVSEDESEENLLEVISENLCEFLRGNKVPYDYQLGEL